MPVVNENDAIANDELRYGDNDRLAALVANSVGADVLVLLTDMDGVYTADPRRDPSRDADPAGAASAIRCSRSAPTPAAAAAGAAAWRRS